MPTNILTKIFMHNLLVFLMHFFANSRKTEELKSRCQPYDTFWKWLKYIFTKKKKIVWIKKKKSILAHIENILVIWNYHKCNNYARGCYYFSLIFLFVLFLKSSNSAFTWLFLRDFWLKWLVGWMTIIVLMSVHKVWRFQFLFC